MIRIRRRLPNLGVSVVSVEYPFEGNGEYVWKLSWDLIEYSTYPYERYEISLAIRNDCSETRPSNAKFFQRPEPSTPPPSDPPGNDNNDPDNAKPDLGFPFPILAYANFSKTGQNMQVIDFPNPGQPLYIAWAVRNYGNAKAENFVNRMHWNGTPWAQSEAPLTLQPGEAVYEGWWFHGGLAAGTQTFAVRLDFGDNVDEIDDTINNYTSNSLDI